MPEIVDLMPELARFGVDGKNSPKHGRKGLFFKVIFSGFNRTMVGLK